MFVNICFCTRRTFWSEDINLLRTPIIAPSDNRNNGPPEKEGDNRFINSFF